MHTTKGSLYAAIQHDHKLVAGQQVVMVPTHAHGDVMHPDCKLGFIARESNLGRTVVAYFWKEQGVSVRTNFAQFTDSDRLVLKNSVEQDVVDKLVKELNENEMHATYHHAVTGE